MIIQEINTQICERLVANEAAANFKRKLTFTLLNIACNFNYQGCPCMVYCYNTFNKIPR